MEPNPANAGQTVRINGVIQPPPPTDVFQHLVVKIAKPDGATALKGPYDSLSNGSVVVTFETTSAGDYQVWLNFSGQSFGDVYYLPSQGQANFTVITPTLGPAPPKEAGVWTSMRDMHHARADLAVATVNGKIYAIGGRSETGIVGTPEEFDPATDTWTTKAPMPTPRESFATAIYQNKIYCLGGTVGYSNEGRDLCTRANEVYDPATDSWETKASTPTARSDLEANAVNGKIYVMDGRPDGTRNEVYDTATNSWTAKAPMPTEAHGASAVLGNKIYCIGAIEAEHPEDCNPITQIYDPETNQWSQGTPPPTAFYTGTAGTATGTAGERVYVFDTPFADPVYPNAPTYKIQIYSLESDSWAVDDPAPTPRPNYAVAAFNNTFYVIGGFIKVSDGDILTLFLPVYEATTLNERYTPLGHGTSQPSPSPSPSASPSQSPSPSPTPTSTPSPTQTPASSLSPTKTPAQTVSPSTSDQQPTSSSESPETSLWTTAAIGLVSAATISIVAVAAFLIRKRHKSSI